MGAELTVALVARRLCEGAAEEFQQHVAICPKCEDAIAAQDTVWTALDDFRAAPVSAAFDEKLFRRIAADERHARRAS